MSSFIDQANREWSVNIDAILIDRVREEADPKFLLNDTDEDNTAKRLANDPSLFCHTIFVLCEKQRNERGVTLDDFYREVIGNGEAIEAAGEALQQAIANFTSPRKRQFIEAITKKEREVEDLAMQRALAKVNDPALAEKILATLDTNLDAALAKALTPAKSATNSPALSESTPSV